MMRDMAEVLGPKMVSQLSTKCLKSLILQESNGSKQRAKDNILQLHQFREELKDMSQWLINTIIGCRMLNLV